MPERKSGKNHRTEQRYCEHQLRWNEKSHKPQWTRADGSVSERESIAADDAEIGYRYAEKALYQALGCVSRSAGLAELRADWVARVEQVFNVPETKKLNQSEDGYRDN
jgi:hypothetical protein